MCSAIPGLLDLGSIRKQAEQVRGSEPVRIIPPWPLHQLLLPDLLEFQSCLPLVMNRDMEVCAGIETLTKTNWYQHSGVFL